MLKWLRIAVKWETRGAMAHMRIKDIAAEAGVSPATVSRYLNNRPGQMTEETRARIAEVIERTGYRPRAAARNLRSSRTNLIGVILADIANPFSSAMLEGLSASAAARGCSLMTAISGNDPAKGWIKWVFVFVIPLVAAGIVCGIFYAQMKTANEQTHANAYMPAEGLALSVVEDTYTHTTETEKYDPVKDDSSSSGSSTDSDGFGGSSGGKF